MGNNLEQIANLIAVVKEMIANWVSKSIYMFSGNDQSQYVLQYVAILGDLRDW